MNQYENVRMTDIPFEVFTLFSRSGQKTHAQVLLTAAAMASEDLEGAVQYDALAAAVRGEWEEEDGQDAAAREIALLKSYRLVRRQSRYDRAERKWVDYIYLTGRGRKTADFLVSVSQTDIQESK